MRLRKLIIFFAIVGISGLLIPRLALLSKSFKKINKIIDNSVSRVLKKSIKHEMNLNSLQRKYYEKNGDIYYVFDNEKVRISNFNNTNTAFLVVDPWDNFPDEFSNKNYGDITLRKIKPLLEKALKKSYPVYIATNKCTRKVTYSCGIDNNLSSLKDLKIIHHFYETTSSFASKLRLQGIKNIIYMGYSSNMCLLGSRGISMIPMRKQNFNLFFLPEASAAVEFKESWENNEIHKNTTSLISQWIGALIKYDDLLNSLK